MLEALIKCSKNFQTEVYCYRILAAIRDDLGRQPDQHATTLMHERLAFLRSVFLKFERPDLTLDLLDLELNLYKERITIYPIQNSDFLFDNTGFAIDPFKANEICEAFMADTPSEQTSDPYQVQVAMVSGFARLVLVECLVAAKNPELWRNRCERLIQEARFIFSWTKCRLGFTQTSLLELRVCREVAPSTQSWETIKRSFEEMRFFPGLIRLIELQAAHVADPVDLQSVSISPRVCIDSLSLLKGSGNKLTFQLKQLYSMTSWLQSPTFILICERIFYQEDGFHSDRLAFVASTLLCKFYKTNKNFQESYIYAVLCLRYAWSRDDPMAQHTATLLFLDALGNITATMSDPARVEEITNLAGIWDKWIYIILKVVISKLDKSDNFIPWHDLPFQSLAWLANTISCNIEDNISIQPQTEQLFLTLKAALSLTCELLLLAPQQVRNIHASKFLRALGTAIEHIGNPLLALQLYEHATVQCGHAQMENEAQNLQLEMARRLDSLLYYARPMFIDLLPLCQAYLSAAEAYFWTDTSMQSSYRNGVAASMLHARFHLRCVHHAIDDTDWGEDNDGDTPSEAQKAEQAELIGLCNRGVESVRTGLTGM